MLRVFIFAFKDVYERPSRTLLLIVGIAIAVATFVCVQVLLRSFEQAVTENVSVTGTQIEVVESGAIDFLSSHIPEALAVQVGKIPGVASASPMLVRLLPIDGNSILALGWPKGSYLWDSVSITRTQDTVAEEAPSALIGRPLADRLNVPAGGSIDLLGSHVRVAGVFETHSRINQNAVLLELPYLQEISFRKGQATAIAIRVRPDYLANIEAVRQSIEAATGPGYSVQETANLVSGNKLLALVGTFTFALSIVASLVGALGVLNTVLTLVRERRHELVVLGVIGWPIYRLYAFVLCEALQVGVAGWCLGVTGGYVAARAFAASPMFAQFLSLSTDLKSIAYSGGACLVICALGSALAIARIVRLEPASVLRSP